MPDVLAFADELADRPRLFSIAASKLDLRTDFDPPTRVTVPKSPLFLRQATDLTLSDRLAYQAIAQEIDKYTDPRLSPRCYAFRTRDRQRRYPESALRGWHQWRSDTQLAVASCQGWMIKTDITTYFDFVDHQRLYTLLREAGVPDPLLKPLRAMLTAWSPVPGKGLPQGPDASSILANYYLVDVDERIQALPNVEYFRYMDDFRIVSDSRADATGALHLLGKVAFEHGLPLSTQKTEALRAAEAIADLKDDTLDAISYQILPRPGRSNQRDARDRLTELFEKSLPSATSSQLNRRWARFSLYRLFQRGERRVLDRVLENLENLGPLESLVPRYVSPWIAEPDVSAKVADYLESRERNTSDYMATWLLATVLQDPSYVDPRIFNYARTRAEDRNSPAYLRAVALNVMAVSGRAADRRAIEQVLFAEYEPVVVRGAIVALHRAGILTRQIRDRIGRRASHANVLAYLQGRQSDALPSISFGTGAPS